MTTSFVVGSIKGENASSRRIWPFDTIGARWWNQPRETDQKREKSKGQDKTKRREETQREAQGSKKEVKRDS